MRSDAERGIENWGVANTFGSRVSGSGTAMRLAATRLEYQTVIAVSP